MNEISMKIFDHKIWSYNGIMQHIYTHNICTCTYILMSTADKKSPFNKKILVNSVQASLGCGIRLLFLHI